jgi:Flp pilus assembly protein TadG
MQIKTMIEARVCLSMIGAFVEFSIVVNVANVATDAVQQMTPTKKSSTLR